MTDDFLVPDETWEKPFEGLFEVEAKTGHPVGRLNPGGVFRVCSDGTIWAGDVLPPGRTVLCVFVPDGDRRWVIELPSSSSNRSADRPQAVMGSPFDGV